MRRTRIQHKSREHMRYKHLALLLLAGNFLLTSLPAQAELEDAPLPGDFQSAQPAKQPRAPAPVAPQHRQEKPRSSAKAASAHAESPSKKQATRHSKLPHKPRASFKSRHKMVKRDRHAMTSRQAGKHPVKAGKKGHLAVRKNEQAKHLKKTPVRAHSTAKPTKKVRVISKKPLKTVKKKTVALKRKK